MQNTLLSINQMSRFCLILRQTRCVRCIQTTARRKTDDSDGGSKAKDDASIDHGSHGSNKKSSDVTTSKLLNVLADLKVQRALDGDGGMLIRKRKVSAAANFQRMVSRAERRKEMGEEEVEGEEGEGALPKEQNLVEGEKKQVEELKLPGLEEIQELTIEAAKKVAEVYPDQEVVESDLLKELRRHDEATATGEKGDTEGISSVLSGIRVQRQTSMEKQLDSRDQVVSGHRGSSEQFDGAFPSSGGGFRPEFGEGQEERKRARGEPYQRQRKRTLFDRQRLNIFAASPESEATPAEGNTVWDKELQKELTALSYSTLRNGFEEAMKLTEEGKLWKYPVDNEQGMEEEQSVAFHEHLFLDHLLEDFPKRVQVLDFMELVLIGLSKNPFLTVAQKHGHVAWFREYFWKKEEIFERMEEEEKEKENEKASSI